MTNQTGDNLPPIKEDELLTQHQQEQINLQLANAEPLSPKKVTSNLTQGTREEYLSIGVPLYDASIRCDWKAAKAIIDMHQKMDLIRCGLTENSDTMLHIAASAKNPKHVEKFVKNLVDMMAPVDLEIQNETGNTALYIAAMAGHIKAVKIMVEKNRNLLRIPGAYGNIMPLYAAVLFGNEDVVRYLYNKSNNLRDKACWTDENRGWLLEKCVEMDMFDVALRIVELYPELSSGTGNVLGLLARKPEVFPERTDNMISWTVNGIKNLFSYTKICIPQQPPHNKDVVVNSGRIRPAKSPQTSEPLPETKPNFFTRTIKSVSAYINGELSEKEKCALQLLRIIWGHIVTKSKQDIDDILRGPKDDSDDVKPASEREELQQVVSEHIANMHIDIQNNIIKMLPSTEDDDQTLQLQNIISEHIAKMHVKTQSLITGPATTSDDYNVESSEDTEPKYSSRVLFVAAEMGNTIFVVELIRQYPDLIWKRNDDGLSIFHIAAKYRHEGIYNLLYEIGSMKNLLTHLKDENLNNMLHLVAKSAKNNRLEDVSGVALQMQRELLWFREVKTMIPQTYRERKNKEGLTPYELFTREHKDLVLQGEKWMKDTASQCMVVAALIATIVFAAAFTVPGGYNQDTGIPIFRSKATFMVFVVSDAISLFASSASILMFLSILTSRYAQRDFLESLPKKLMLGLATLFVSIVSMTVAFSVSFFVLYHRGLLWMPILIGVFALFPVLLYLVLQFGLFFDVFRSIYMSRYIFKPTKQVLYYKNPTV